MRDPRLQAAIVREDRLLPVECTLPADPPDGTYTGWRTFACRLTHGEPAARGRDGTAELTAVRWLPLWDGAAWDAALGADPFLCPQLERIRAALAAPCRAP